MTDEILGNLLIVGVFCLALPAVAVLLAAVVTLLGGGRDV